MIIDKKTKKEKNHNLKEKLQQLTKGGCKKHLVICNITISHTKQIQSNCMKNTGLYEIKVGLILFITLMPHKFIDIKRLYLITNTAFHDFHICVVCSYCSNVVCSLELI